MGFPIVLTAALSLLTTSPEKPLCCYATERGWIVHELWSPDVHFLRPHVPEGFSQRVVLTSGKLTPSNLKDHRLSTLVIDNRLILEYSYYFGGGWLPGDGSIDKRCRGECSIADLFDGKVVGQDGKPSSLFSKVVHTAIAGDMIETRDDEILGVHSYEADDKTLMMGWFKGGGLSKMVPSEEKYNVPCPFKGQFKCLYNKDRYYFVTDSGVLYTSSCDKDGKPREILPVFLGFREPITAVVSVISTKKTYIFTRHRYFELTDIVPTPKQLRELKESSFSKVDKMVDDLSTRTKYMYQHMYLDKAVDRIKLDAK